MKKYIATLQVGAVENPVEENITRLRMLWHHLPRTLSVVQMRRLYRCVCRQTQRRQVDSMPDHVETAISALWTTYASICEQAFANMDWKYPCKQTLHQLDYEYMKPYQEEHRRGCFAARSMHDAVLEDPVTAAAVMAAVQNAHTYDLLAIAGFRWDAICHADDYHSFDLVRDVLGLESALCIAFREQNLTIDACVGWTALRRAWILLAVHQSARSSE